MQYEPGVFPIANLENAGQRSQQIKGAKQKHYTNNENMYNMSHGISGYSALMAMFGREDGSRAPGALYDIQDLSKLYQDKLRTTPVTALEQSVGSVTDISGNGNHAYQTTAANRPIVSARYNLLTKTEEFDDPLWIKTRCTVVANSAVAPNGNLTADALYEDGTLAASHVVAFPLTIADSVPIKIKHRFKAGLGRDWAFIRTVNKSSVDVQTYFNLVSGTVGSVGHDAANISYAGNGWYECEVSLNSGVAGVGSVSVQFGSAQTNGIFVFDGDPSKGIYVWGIDLRNAVDFSLNIPPYQRVNTAADYDSTGFPKYLKGNGTTQFLQTDAIDFSGTDKMTVIAGVGKLSDAGAYILAELTASAATNDGAWNIYTNAPNRYETALRATVAQEALVFTAYAAPVNNIISTQLDISKTTPETRTVFKSNGVTDTPDSVTGATTATGTFANAPVYILSRGGVSNFFPSRLYGLAICGRSVNPYPLFLAEEEMGTKMGIELA